MTSLQMSVDTMVNLAYIFLTLLIDLVRNMCRSETEGWLVMVTAFIVGFLLLSLLATVALVSACVLSGRTERSDAAADEPKPRATPLPKPRRQFPRIATDPQ